MSTRVTAIWTSLATALAALGPVFLQPARAEDWPAQASAPADLDYAHAPERSEAGLPIGNGRVGTLVWTGPGAVHLQINRSDVFNVSGSSTSFPQRSTDGCCGCAAVDIAFGPSADAFPADRTRAHLDCGAGVASLSSPAAAVRALAWMDEDVIALEIAGRAAGAAPTASLRGLRPDLVRTRRHEARTTHLDRDGLQIVEQRFSEGAYLCRSAVALRTTGGRGGEPLRIFIGSATAFDDRTDLAALAAARANAAADRGFDALVSDNRTWWSGFWGRSRIHLHSADGAADRIEAGYAYFLYIMAATSRGVFPTKFNGMLWNTEGDTRKWGGAYWGANQSCLYNNALFAADHAELMEPMFAMYTRMIPNEERAAREEWGSRGIYFPETVTFDGLAALPPEIAAEMPELYLLKQPWEGRSARFRDYAGLMQPYTSRWNFIDGGRWENGRWVYTERGSGPFGPTSHILSRGAKIAYQYWQRYQYTADEDWLRRRAYPVLKGVAAFYRNFPNVRRGADGRWHISGVNSNEGLWGGTDTDEEIASMRGVFATLIRASEILNVDSDQRADWREFLTHLAPLPRSDLPEVFMPAKSPAPIWQRSFLPVVHGAYAALPDSNTMPQWFFDGCSLASPAAMLTIGNDTFDAMRHRRPSNLARARAGAPGGAARSPYARTGRVSVLSKLPLAAAELGRADAFRELLMGQMLGGESLVLENRMDLREGEQTQGVERLGDGADALHTALCLDLPPAPGEAPIIRIFAAWPKEWDADFRLVCRGNFVVSARQSAGQIGPVTVLSRSGGELRMVNPWPSAQIVRGAAAPVRSEASVLTLATQPGEKIVLQPGATSGIIGP